MQLKMQGAEWRADVERWESDEDSDRSNEDDDSTASAAVLRLIA